MSYKPKTCNTIIVGQCGNFTTLKAAVDWFNSSATDDTEIELDAGHHLVADTITVNNGVYNLFIRGKGTSVTFLEAFTGLTNKPMFNIVSLCDLSSIYFDGSTLLNYGTLVNENCITYDTTDSLYSEITDVIVDNFNIAISDLIGVSFFMFNFIVSNCVVGIAQNYSTGAITTSIDLEVGNFESCTTGINLVKATSAKFYLAHLLFFHSVAETALVYTGGPGNYVLTAGDGNAILNCSYNNIGHFLTGFDFTLARDADIEVLGNSGEEDKNPHAKINVVDNLVTTTLTNASQYYKLSFVNGFSYTCKMTLADGKMTFLSTHKRDGMLWLAGNISINRPSTTINVALRKNIFVTSVTGNGALVTVTTTGHHDLDSGLQVQMLDWAGGAGVWNGRYIITVTGENTFTYVATGNGVAVGGTAGAILSPFTVRTVTLNQPYPFAANIYMDGMVENDYYDLIASCPNAGDIVTMQDLTWFLETR